MRVKFSILGPPKGKARPRSTKNGVTYTPKETVQYENLVRLEYRRQCNDYHFPEGVPLDVRIVAYYPIPKSVSKKKRLMMIAHLIRPTKKPDFDNIGKIVCDSLNDVAYHDDAQICDAMVRKFYAEMPRTVVTIRECKGFEQEEGK